MCHQNVNFCHRLLQAELWGANPNQNIQTKKENQSNFGHILQRIQIR